MADFLSTMFGGGAEREAAERNRQLAAQYGLDANSFLREGYDTGTENYNKAIGAYQPLSQLATKYNQAGDLWLDAQGVNGPEGVARAQAAFPQTPGWALTRDAIDQANARRFATSGMYRSGNAVLDLDRATEKSFWETQYQPWLSGLERAAGMGGQYTAGAAGGEAAGWGNLANLAQQYAGNRVGVAGQVLGQNTAANNLQAQGEAAGASRLLNLGIQAAGAIASGGTSLLAGGLPMGSVTNRAAELFAPTPNINVGGYSMQRVGPSYMY